MSELDLTKLCIFLGIAMQQRVGFRLVLVRMLEENIVLFRPNVRGMD